MEKKEVVKMKMEANINGSFSYSETVSNTYPFSSIFDFCEDEKGPLGFMELLGVQDFSPSLFDFPQASSALTRASSNPNSTKKKSCDNQALNQQPTTPNSSSISSASSEAVNDHELTKTIQEEEEEEEEHDQQKTKKQLKAKKTNEKRQREPRFAFMTKSEVDHLEDGYRWRKYGQKAVKNSRFPRSYYRCTSSSCNVKKRVERSYTDPTIVVTTYEGQHTHPSPVIPRTTNHAGPPQTSVISGGYATNFGMTMPSRTLPHYNYHHHHRHHEMSQQQQVQPHVDNLTQLNFSYNCSSASNAAFLNEKRIIAPRSSPASSALLSDHGLLQDILPSHMLKQE